MIKRKLLASAVILGLFAVVLNACKKETPDTETDSAVDNSICEQEFTKSMSTVNGYAMRENGVRGVMGAMAMGPTITVDPADTLNGFPVTMTIDYGTTGLTDSLDQKVRKGVITCVFSNYWHIVGSSVKVSFSNYSVNGVSYACDSMKIVHSSASGFTQQIFKGVCTSADWTLKWEGTRTVTQTAGTGDMDPNNDVFSVTGSSNGVNRKGKAYTTNITVPVVKRAACSWIESGRLDITPEGMAVRTLDYGDGACDNKATLTINGNVFTFNMN
ncbi:MAG: lipoprotein precursor [Bacteroidota bacterium]|nr:lipoprotein precursor [Bacteroidota bacterium]